MNLQHIIFMRIMATTSE